MQADRRLLIVEPDNALARGVMEALGSLFTEIVLTDNPVHALQLINQHCFEVVLAEAAYPLTNGVDILKVMAKIKPDVQIVVWTSYAAELKEILLEVGIKTILEKPVELEVLKLVFHGHQTF
ncbi:response regulator [bacterium]|nr:response regulator [bacterium]